MALQYNSHSTNQDIVTMAEKLTKSSSASFPIADKTLYANEAMRNIWAWIYDVYGGWIYDDTNQTDLPIATANLVANQTFYALPTDSSHLIHVEFKDGGGIWNKLKPLPLELIGQGESEFEKTPSSHPVYYRPVANGFKIYPASDTSRNLALRIHQSRDISSFTTTDTTKTPGFDTLFHEAVPTFMAWRYSEINGLKNKDDLRRQWSNENRNYPLGYEQKIKKHYSQKFNELFPPRFKMRDVIAHEYT